MYYKLFDLLTDKRLPFYIPFVYKDKKNLFNSINHFNYDVDLKICLSFDVEYYKLISDYFSFNHLLTFLDDINVFLKKGKISSTFFIQGNLLKYCAKRILSLHNHNEIGLHGYSHGLWGDYKWFIKNKPLTHVQKYELLTLSLEEFLKYKLEKPVSFRAPNMVTNKDTYELLSDHGFILDSSSPSYYGNLPLPTFPLGVKDNIFSIPVSVNPIPELNFKCIFPYLSYNILNLKTMKKINILDFLNYINIIISVQQKYGYVPHIVLLFHSWEFSHSENNKYNYCRTINYDVLTKLINTLNKYFTTEYLTMSNLVEYIR